jgi:hypothetical protein
MVDLSVSKALIDYAAFAANPRPQRGLEPIHRSVSIASTVRLNQLSLVNTESKIDLMRQYLDAGSIWAQFK